MINLKNTLHVGFVSVLIVLTVVSVRAEPLDPYRQASHPGESDMLLAQNNSRTQQQRSPYMETALRMDGESSNNTQNEKESAQSDPAMKANNTSLDSNNSGNGRSSSVNPIRNKTWKVGINYPGIALGVSTGKVDFEIRANKGDDITLYGPRFKHNVFPFSGGNLYWGLDAFYISEFEGDLTKGDGYMGGGFIGFQKFLGSYFSVSLDSGPYYVKVKDDLSGLDSGGVQFVVNTSLNLHF